MKQRLKKLFNKRKWRVSFLVLSGLLVAGSAFGVYSFIIDYRYSISDEFDSIIGEVNSDLAERIQYDTNSETFHINRLSVQEEREEQGSSEVTTEPLKKTAGSGDVISEQFAIELAKQGGEGIEIKDKNLDLSFSIIPKFEKGKGRVVDGRLVYPTEGNNVKTVYTINETGLKEDILFESAPESGEAQFSYNLDLPDELEARLQDDGSIGIFSANPNVFADDEGLSLEDKKKLKEARIYTPKYHKVFELPAPIIITANNQNHRATAKFRLSENTLTLSAYNLDSIEGGFSVDPTVVVSSTAELSASNANGVDFSNNL